jgi:hypothetical protein
VSVAEKARIISELCDLMLLTSNIRSDIDRRAEAEEGPDRRLRWRTLPHVSACAAQCVAQHLRTPPAPLPHSRRCFPQAA